MLAYNAVVLGGEGRGGVGGGGREREGSDLGKAAMIARERAWGERGRVLKELAGRRWEGGRGRRWARVGTEREKAVKRR